MNQFDRIGEDEQDMLVEALAFPVPSAPGFQDHHLIVQALRAAKLAADWSLIKCPVFTGHPA